MIEYNVPFRAQLVASRFGTRLGRIVRPNELRLVLLASSLRLTERKPAIPPHSLRRPHLLNRLLEPVSRQWHVVWRMSFTYCSCRGR